MRGLQDPRRLVVSLLVVTYYSKFSKKKIIYEINQKLPVGQDYVSLTNSKRLKSGDNSIVGPQVSDTLKLIKDNWNGIGIIL